MPLDGINQKRMRIEIDVEAANIPGEHEWLDRILHKIMDGWHVWDTSRISDPNVFEGTAWIAGSERIGNTVRELLIKSIARSSWGVKPHSRCIRVTTEPNAPNELSPKDAYRLAANRLVILVENRFSDGGFVERIVKELDEHLSRWWQTEGEPVRIDSLGGKGQMEKAVLRYSEAVPYRPRLVVIADSDRKEPGQELFGAPKSLSKECRRKNIPCWILAKREAENYLPRSFLSAWVDSNEHPELVDAWDRLSEDQKDFYDMKKGLRKMKDAALFENLPVEDKKSLRKGFGDNVHKCWNQPVVPGDTRLELIERGRGDLQLGLDLIRSEV